MDKSPMSITNAEAKRIKAAIRDKMTRLTAKQRTSSSSDYDVRVNRIQNGSYPSQIRKSVPFSSKDLTFPPSTCSDTNLTSLSSKFNQPWKPLPLIVETLSSDSEDELMSTDIVSYLENHNTKTVIPDSGKKRDRIAVEASVTHKKTDTVPVPIESHYRRNFIIHLVEIQTNENLWDLFNIDDMTIFNEFTGLPPEAQTLYIRLLDIKHSWHRESSLVYPEITQDLGLVINDLVGKRFLTTDISKEDILVLVDLLTLPELKSLCKDFCLRVDGRKETLARSLIEFSNNQILLCGEVAQDIKTVIREKVITSLGRLVKLSCTHRQLFQRTMLLYSLPLAGAMEMDGRIPLLNTMNRVSANQITYPDYALKSLLNIFTSRETFIRFQDALILEATIKGKTISKDLDEVVTLHDIAQLQFFQLLGNPTIRSVDENLPLYIRMFRSGTVLARALHCCMDCLRIKKMYSKMISTYEILLSQEVYLTNCRGIWYDQLAQIYHQYLKDIPKSVDFLIEALTDPTLTPIDRVLLSKRGELIANRKKKNKAEAEKNATLISMLSRVKDPPELQIQARCFQNKIGGETRVTYVYESEEGIGQIFSSVEEIVMLYHKQKGYDHAIQSEKSIAISIFGILFWDIIYKTDVPNVFISPYQIYPLDLKSGEFYNNREKLIIQRIAEIEELWSDEKMSRHIKSTWSRENGKESIVSWKSFEDFNQFQVLVEYIGREVISKICHRIARKFPIAHKGFPTIIIWNQTTKKCKFIKVKCPGIELTPSQKSWLAYLNTAGADVCACIVNAVGAKSLKRKSDVADNTDPLYSDDPMDLC